MGDDGIAWLEDPAWSPGPMNSAWTAIGTTCTVCGGPDAIGAQYHGPGCTSPLATMFPGGDT